MHGSRVVGDRVVVGIEGRYRDTDGCPAVRDRGPDNRVG